MRHPSPSPVVHNQTAVKEAEKRPETSGAQFMGFKQWLLEAGQDYSVWLYTFKIQPCLAGLGHVWEQQGWSYWSVKRPEADSHNVFKQKMNLNDFSSSFKGRWTFLDLSEMSQKLVAELRRR